MKILLKNIGILTEAMFDFSKDLIILCGPNNTGKTYAAYSIYGIYSLAQNNRRRKPIKGRTLQTFEEDGSISLNIEDFFNEVKKQFIKEYEDSFIKFLPSLFAADDSFFKDSQISIQIEDKDIINDIYTKGFKNQIKLGSNLTIQLEKAPESLICEIITIQEGPQHSVFKSLGAELVYDTLIELFSQSIFNHVYITPAERSAINIFSRELSVRRNAIIDELLELREKKSEIDPLKKVQRYPLPIRDSLAIAEDLGNLQKEKSDFEFLANRLEEYVLKGKIKVSKEGDLQFTPNKGKVKNLNIHLTASIVKSLSNLVFYFRHLAKKGDFIIIDEPELNLHPDNQRIIARFLGEIVNNGFKVMISTHSDYIIRELNNMIMLHSGGDKAKELISKYEYKDYQLLDYNRVGSYLFKTNKNVSLEMSETGFEVSTIDEEINKLNRTSEDIYFSLFD
ncbi:AAA family ATPase [Runella slithyformis]|nr:AAA family ATPase [Runella slithyformis]